MMNTESVSIIGALFLCVHSLQTVSLLNLSFAAMKKVLIGFFSLIFFWACNNADQQQPAPNQPENDLDAARTFIRDALDGKFEHAKQLMLKDSTNEEMMDVVERSYERSPESERVAYRSASIQIHNTQTIGDTTFVAYSNSYKNQNQNLKLIKVNGQWLVDFKYTFQGKR
jgi:hypothetical protein